MSEMLNSFSKGFIIGSLIWFTIIILNIVYKEINNDDKKTTKKEAVIKNLIEN